MGYFSERVIGTAASTLDRAVAAVMHKRPSQHERLSHGDRLRMLWEAHEAYSAPELYAHPDAFFTPPEPIEPRLRFVRDLPLNGRVVDASWQSRFEPYLEGMRDLYATYMNNATAYARLFLHAAPRPAVVLIHGYRAGQFRLEEMVWPIRWFYKRGMDVALVQLPFHGNRATGSPDNAAPFPGPEPRITNEGFRQSIHDLRALVRWLRARGAPDVGVTGMSLGGYTTALLATVERDLAFAVPIIPLASMADFARDHRRLGGRRERPAQHRALEAANFVVSPFARPSLLPSDRVLIVAAMADKITPPSHAVRLAHHFAADLVRFPGGHLMQIGIRVGYKAIAELLERIEVMEPRQAKSEPAGDILPSPVAA